MTSEYRRGRMAHATTRNGKNRNDAIACLTRTRGLESAQMTRTRDQRVRVTREKGPSTRAHDRRVRVTCATCRKRRKTLGAISGLF
ncbi:Retrotransposon gag protein [Arachis hypogaea]|nr:Retrotransposon gag protein [Arachis hypogaea]